MHTFKLDLLPPCELRDTTDETGRHYHTPEGKFPSVTTILGWDKGTEWLDKWKKRVGEEEAAFISRKATERGNAVHNMAERYIKGDPDWAHGQSPLDVMTFRDIRPHLDKRLGVVRGIEYPLWSALLRTAGRTDLVAEWDGVMSILDFKTSKRIKTEDDILHYFIQKACYGLMLYERTGIRVKQIVTLMMVDHQAPQIFVKKRSDYDDEVMRIFVRDRTDLPVYAG